MKSFGASETHHSDEEDGSQRGGWSSSKDPPGSITIQLSRAISERSLATLGSSPARLDGSGSSEVRSILRKPLKGGDLDLSRSSNHEASSSGSRTNSHQQRPRLLGHRSKSEWNVTGACKSKAKRKKDGKHASTQGHHGPGSFLADLIAARRTTFVSLDDDDDVDHVDPSETDTTARRPPQFIHTTAVASQPDSGAPAVPLPCFDRACRVENNKASARTSRLGGADLRHSSDCPFDEDFTILQRKASERSLKCHDARDDASGRSRTAPSRSTSGGSRIVGTTPPLDRCHWDDRATAASPHSEALQMSIAQISIDDPSVVDFVPNGGCFDFHRPRPYPEEHDIDIDDAAKPSLCGTIVTTTTISTSSAEEASSLEDSSSERSQRVQVMVNLSYLELDKASFSKDVCYLVD